MQTTETKAKCEIWHKEYNLEKKENLNEIPDQKAVFGVFGIVNEEPINCRYIGETENLQEAVKELFENPQSKGMKEFMQGPWIQMLVYETMPESTEQERQKLCTNWIQEYKPNIDDEGEYPGYYEN